MSQKNEDLARRAYEALQREDIEGFLGVVDPEVEWHSLVLEVEGVRLMRTRQEAALPAASVSTTTSGRR